MSVGGNRGSKPYFCGRCQRGVGVTEVKLDAKGRKYHLCGRPLRVTVYNRRRRER